MELITKQDAISQGLKRYFTGEPCKRGHVSERLVKSSNCIECRKMWPHTLKYGREWQKEYRRKNPIHALFMGAKTRAKRLGIEFTIREEELYLPTTCPILGIALTSVGGKKSNSTPSLDRVDCSKGYVTGNVRIISMRANEIKNNATVDILKAIIKYIEENEQN